LLLHSPSFKYSPTSLLHPFLYSTQWCIFKGTVA
jgi:hypothetical protein